eukprot:1462246-Rhodomonas_salina.2
MVLRAALSCYTGNFANFLNLHGTRVPGLWVPGYPGTRVPGGLPLRLMVGIPTGSTERYAFPGTRVHVPGYPTLVPGHNRENQGFQVDLPGYPGTR